jgi:hypothetical protein
MVFVWHVDVFEGTCSIPSKPYLPDIPLHYLAEYSINAKTTGILQNHDFLEVSPQPPLSSMGGA